MMDIRPYQASDVPSILALLAQLQAVELAYQPARKSAPEVGANDIWEETTKFLADGKADVLVASAEGKVIGVGIGYETVLGDQSLALAVRRVGYVSDLVVDAAWRGKGIGRAVLQDLMECFRKRGLKTARIGAIIENQGAIRLYQEMGFAQVSVAMERPL